MNLSEVNKSFGIVEIKNSIGNLKVLDLMLKHFNIKLVSDRKFNNLTVLIFTGLLDELKASFGFATENKMDIIKTEIIAKPDLVISDFLTNLKNKI